MIRFSMALAAMGATALPFMAIADSGPATPVLAQAAPVTIGLDKPILLKRMVVTATALPDAG